MSRRPPARANRQAIPRGYARSEDKRPPASSQRVAGRHYLPGDIHTLGTPLLTNLTFQYHLLELLWPEVEVNYTYWPNGANRGKNQVFITPGVVLGRIRLYGRLNHRTSYQLSEARIRGRSG